MSVLCVHYFIFPFYSVFYRFISCLFRTVHELLLLGQKFHGENILEWFWCYVRKGFIHWLLSPARNMLASFLCAFLLTNSRFRLCALLDHDTLSIRTTRAPGYPIIYSHVPPWKLGTILCHFTALIETPSVFLQLRNNFRRYFMYTGFGIKRLVGCCFQLFYAHKVIISMLLLCIFHLFSMWVTGTSLPIKLC